MGDVLTEAREQQNELATGADLLRLQVLGIEFTVRWGRGVAYDQRESTAEAWSRCTSSTAPNTLVLPSEPHTAQPFAASVAYRAGAQSVQQFDLGASTFGELAEDLTSRLTVAAIFANAGQLTMLHACGIADPVSGATVALVAKSGTGKTTAASVLARAHGYVTDETVAIRSDGSIVAYPKPLSVKQAPGNSKRQVGPDQLGLMRAPAHSFLQSVVLLNRVANRQTNPILEKVPLARGVLALIPDSSSQGELRQPLQSFCRLIDSVGGVWQVTYAEAADLPAALAPLFHTQPQRTSEWQPRATYAAINKLLPKGYLQRTAAKDAVAIGEDLLVMLDSGIVQLSGIGPAIWEAACHPVEPRQLAEEVAKVHGRPAGYRDSVASAVSEFVAAGVLNQGH